MLKVLLVDDQNLVREALAALLELTGEVEVSAQASNGNQALELLEQHPEIDILLTDIEMPEMDGLSLCENAQKLYPQLLVCILTTFGRSGYVQRALSAGARGFLVKDAPSKELVTALEKIKAGQKVIDPQLAVEALSLPNSPFTQREKEILTAFTDSATVAEVAAKLFLSPGTVRNHISNIISKTNAKNRAEAARIAKENGWI
ncbi:response regulator receiver domain protein [Gleimia coleocanis DSM 15436]|uniref:Response regulator receiver domain protein n=1 Tax=Gleimia coleocanis DSM 15436 TaxID=525245 RepID=C0W091_9ACTO|nr:response regulator transcription factor [Gleimia coleocanis]EEH63950.1 response regulator receiver domain protein [Gleimia coleocanis DSM 15436]